MILKFQPSDILRFQRKPEKKEGPLVIKQEKLRISVPNAQSTFGKIILSEIGLKFPFSVFPGLLLSFVRSYLSWLLSF